MSTTSDFSDIVTGENGAPAVKNLKSNLLEIFSKQLTRGSMPTLFPLEILDREELETAVVLTFYSRSIKNGAGERDIFYLLFGDLLISYPEVMMKMLEFIPNPQTGGSWNDFNRLICYLSESHPRVDQIKPFMERLIEEISCLWAAQLFKDYSSLPERKEVTLSAKYAPSEKSRCWYILGARISRRLSELMMIETSYRANYRNVLTSLRKYLDITEVKMCAQEWSKIEFSHVPSVAMMIYGSKAFRNLPLEDDVSGPRDESLDRIQCAINFDKYKSDVSKGKSKINGSVVGLHQYGARFENSFENDDLLEIQFMDLLNSIRKSTCLPSDKESIDVAHLIPLVDVSGSMETPISSGVSAMSIAIQLGLILSQLDATSPFSQKVLTFEHIPRWVDLSVHKTNFSKYHAIKNAGWGASTNFEAAFNKVLETAIEKRIPQEDLAKYKLIVFSDMQFNAAEKRPWNTLYEEMVLRFSKKGYRLPGMIYWNLAARPTNGFVVDDSTVGVTMVSGFGIGQLKAMLAGDLCSATPYDKMLEVLSNTAFDPIRETLSSIAFPNGP